MRLVCSPEAAQPSVLGGSSEFWKGDYLVNRKMPWSKMGPTGSEAGGQRSFVPTGGALPCMEHKGEVCAWLLHVGDQQCLTVLMVSLVLKSLLCFLCVTSMEADEVVVSLMDYGVPQSVCHVTVVQMLKQWPASSCD